MFKPLGSWLNQGEIELVEINGIPFALYGWNGEEYLHCWICIDAYEAPDNKQYIIRPVYDDEFEIVDYEVSI